MATIAARLRFLIVVGVGFFEDGRFNSTIGLVVPMLGYVYFQDKKGSMPTILSDVIKASFSNGIVVGQVLFSIFGDAIGRRHVYGKELICTIIGALLVILMPWGDFSHRSVVAWMCCFRMLTGVGVGGATITAEGDKLNSRAKIVLTIFAGGSLGYMAPVNLETFVWYWTYSIGFDNVFSSDNAGEQAVSKITDVVEETNLDKRGLAEQWRDFRKYFSVWKHARTLLATSVIWLLFDIAYYGVNLNQSTVLADIGWANGSTPWEILHNTAVGNLIGYVPGYYVAIFLPDLMGHRNQQMLGSIICAMLYAVWAGVTGHASTGGLVTLFTLGQFSLNAGLASTTFLIPVKSSQLAFVAPLTESLRLVASWV